MRILCSLWIFLLLIACSPVKIPASNQYQLRAFTVKRITHEPHSSTVLVTPPETVSSYQTEQMFYMNKPFVLEAFVKNAWVSPPGEMLYPLIVQSLQGTGYFRAVVSNSYTLGADYRLDTQLLSLQQNFLKKPSVLEFSAKIVLTHVADNKVLGSKIINLNIPCPMDTPYGGVIAANRATQQFTAVLIDFVMARV